MMMDIVLELGLRFGNKKEDGKKKNMRMRRITYVCKCLLERIERDSASEKLVRVCANFLSTTCAKWKLCGDFDFTCKADEAHVIPIQGSWLVSSQVELGPSSSQ